MLWTSIIAVYFLFWVMGCFIALRLGMRTAAEAGQDLVPGQANSAPADFRPWRVIRNGTLIATIAFALYYANWTQGWIGAEDLDVFGLASDQAADK
jgi:predicted secreted protein